MADTFGQTAVAIQWPILQGLNALTPVTITTQTGETIDHTTGEITPIVLLTTVEALVSAFSLDIVDGIRITNLDRKVLIRHSDVTTAPAVTSTVLIHGETWSMQSPPELVANEGLWQLHVRQVGQV